MPEKKTASKPETKRETGFVNYINTRVESAPFSLKVGDVTIRAVIQQDNSFVWPIPKEILSQALRHTHLINGRLTAEK
jgi:hypothetical protein|tara:strand:- start:365 stop:598 length:234 start_codon:yes stop_codon:yes gene_type:complete